MTSKGKFLALNFFFFHSASRVSSTFLSPFLDAGRCNNKKDVELLVAFGSHLGHTENQQAYCQPLCFPGPWRQFCSYRGRPAPGPVDMHSHLVKHGVGTVNGKPATRSS